MHFPLAKSCRFEPLHLTDNRSDHATPQPITRLQVQGSVRPVRTVCAIFDSFDASLALVSGPGAMLEEITRLPGCTISARELAQT